VIAYLDTSSLVKLYVDEPGSDEVRGLVSAADVVATSVVAYAEARASFARQRRAKGLTPSAFAEVKRTFDQDWSTYLAIDLTSDVLQRAAALAEQHQLRGFDSIHLASFHQVLERAGDDDVEFSGFDERLVQAARKLQ
jgi:predicted nucleic acid-binding protein